MLFRQNDLSTDQAPPIGVSDQPIGGKDEDWLSLSREASSLANFVARCVTPLTIAVQGDWGSGKTSLLRMVEEHLSVRTPGTTRDRIEVIRFETWQYAQFGGGPALPLSLLSMLARRLSPPGKLAPITNTLKHLARPAANALLRGATMGMTQLDDYEGGQGPDFAEQCDLLRSELKGAIRSKRENGIDRIVVLIDDLDRIEPALAVDILQTIKMFLDLESCVFILALDFAIVKDGVRAKFGITDDRKARAFFDKIIQLPFQVPVARYDVGGFIRRMLADFNEAGFAAQEADTFERLARASITSNPRAIKRVMNSLHLTRMIAADTFDRLGEHRSSGLVTLFGLLCLQTRFPEAYGWLLAQSDAGAALRLFQEPLSDNPVAPGGAIDFSDPRDRDEFPPFATLLAAQADELPENSLAQVLAVTRSTSVGEQQTGYRFSTEAHDENKVAMTEVLNSCQNMLPGVAVAAADVGRREGIRVFAEPQPGVVLSLEHSKSWLGLSVATNSARCAAACAILGRSARIATDGEIHIWSAGVADTTPMWKRRQHLERAPERFIDAWNRLSETEFDE